MQMPMDDFSQQQLDIMQRRKRAQEGQVFKPVEGQMVSGRYVAPHFTQILAEGLRGYSDIQDEKKYDQQLKDLSGKRQEAMVGALRKSNEYMTGAPAVASKTTATEMPTFDDADAASMQGIQGYGATTGGQAAVAPDPYKAANALIESGIPALQTAGINQQMEFQKTNAAEARAQANRAKNLALWKQADGDAVKFAALGGDLAMAETMAKLPTLGKPKPISVGNVLVDPVTFKPVFTAEPKVNMATDYLIPDGKGGYMPNTQLIEVKQSVQAAGRQPAAPKNLQTINTADGPMIINSDGTVRPIIGPNGQPVKGVDSVKPPNEFQGKSGAFGSRAAASHKILNELDYSPVAASVNQAGGALTNWAAPANVQKANQAQRDFVNAVLRQESGAAIGKDEFENARKQYFPQPGDTAQVIAQKRKNRELVIQGFEANAGPAANLVRNQGDGGQGGNVVDFGSLK
jgi:hypothetical protein